jgi:hypothetical protein
MWKDLRSQIYRRIQICIWNCLRSRFRGPVRYFWQNHCKIKHCVSSTYKRVGVVTGTRMRYTCTRFYSSFFTFFRHNSIIHKAEVQNLNNFDKLSDKSSTKSDFHEYHVIAENALFHSAFSAKTLCFTPRINRKCKIPLLLCICCILSKAHSFTLQCRQLRLV